MKLENQVCSLELAKRLKELGVKQESHFSWFPTIGFVKETPLTDDEDIIEREVLSSLDENWKLSCDQREEMRPNIVSAFTVAEFGEMLPPRIELGEPEHPAHRLAFEKQETRWHGTFLCATCKGKLFSEYGETEAECRAKMLIYLLENKLITLN